MRLLIGLVWIINRTSLALCLELMHRVMHLIIICITALAKCLDSTKHAYVCNAWIIQCTLCGAIVTLLLAIDHQLLLRKWAKHHACSETLRSKRLSWRMQTLSHRIDFQGGKNESKELRTCTHLPFRTIFLCYSLRQTARFSTRTG